MAYIDDVYLVVNIAPVGIPTYVRLSQNENGRRLYFAVTGGEIPSGSTATMSGTKPDGVVYSKTGSISGNTVTFNEDIQLTAVAGEWPAKIVIVNGGQTVMTARIRFVIDADTVAAGAVPSDSQLEGLVAQAAAYAEAAKDGAFYGSPLVASTVAEMTDQTRVYVYTGSESGYTSGNWYYWNGSAWTSGGVYNATAVSTDTTLSIAGKAADAKATGDAIAAVTIPTDKTLTVSDAPADAKVVGDELAALKYELSELEPGLSDEAKAALLACFAKVAWVDEHGQDYYDALESALYADSYPKITAQFNSGLNVIYTDDTLDSLKQYLTVKYYETKESTGTVIASANYSLSGSLVEGASTVFVSYSGLTTSFIVDGVVDFYNIWEWRYPSNNRVLLLDQKSPSVYNPTGQYSTLGIYEYSDSIRMMGAVNRGVLPYMHRLEAVFYGGLYPIPIPKEATSVTISAVPSALQISAIVSRYIESENRYEQILGNPGGWQTQPKTFTFDAAQNLFLSMAFRNASNTAMTDSEKPTAYAIEFA